MNPRLLEAVRQAAIAAAAAIAVVLLARARGVDLLADAGIALVRGVGQIVSVGLVLVVLLRGPWWTSIGLLAVMMLAAASTAAGRAGKLPGAFRISLCSIGGGAGSIIALMAALGVIERSVGALIPIGSMLIANAMNANALALERFRSEVASHVAEIESALALGAAPSATVAPYITKTLRASLIPAVDNLRSLGIVWIPGIMAGMILSGTKPLDASIYQFVVLSMVLASSGLTCILGTWLMSASAFSKHEQLAIGPEEKQK